MHPAERLARTIRHLPGLRRAEGLWASVRPAYDALVQKTGAQGLTRNMNGTDPIIIVPEHRGLDETYEPKVWAHLMDTLQPGDTFADVGAYIGLYAVAVARRLGSEGRVVAFEPNHINAAVLRQHVAMNDAAVEIIEAAAGARAGHVSLNARESESQTSYADSGDIACTTLDAVFPDTRLDVLKVDVEGFEEEVLLGASALLNDASRRPRRIYLEVHPFAWERTGTTSASLLDLLASAGYVARRLDGSVVHTLAEWEEIVAEPIA